MHRKSTPYLAVFFLLLCILWFPLFKEPSMNISSADTLLLYPPFQNGHAGYVPQNPLLSDQFTQFYPWLHYNRYQIRRERSFPLWNPHQEMGIPHWANTQNAALAINNLPTYVLPLERALVVRSFFIVFFAFWGMFLLLRLLLKDSLMAFVGAMAFALGGYITVWLGHPHSGVAMWLGWIIWGFLRLVKRPSFVRMIYLSLFLFLSYLGGHIETAFHNVFIVSLFAVCYLAFYRNNQPGERLKILAYFVSAGVISFFMAAVFFFPFIEYLMQSWIFFARSQAIGESYNISFAFILNYFLPGIYGNPTQYFWLIPQFGGNFNEVNGGFFTFTLAVMAIPGLLMSGKRSLTVRITCFIIFFVCFCFAYRVPFLHGILNSLPFFNVGANTRLIFGIAFSGIVLGLMGWKELIEKRMKISTGYIVIIAFLVLLCSGLFYVYRSQISPVYSEWSFRWFRLQGVRLLIIALSLVILCGSGKSAGLKKVFLALVVFLELTWFFMGYNPVIHDKYFFPYNESIRQVKEMGYNRALFMDNIMPANTASYYGIYDIRNYDAMNLKRSIELSHTYRNIVGAWDDYRTCGSPFFNFLGGQFVFLPENNISKYDYYPAQLPFQEIHIDYNEVLLQPFVPVRDNMSSISIQVNASSLDDQSSLIGGVMRDTENLFLNHFEGHVQGQITIDIPSDIILEKGQSYYLVIKTDASAGGSVAISSMHQWGIPSALLDNSDLGRPIWYEGRYDDGRYVFENTVDGLYVFRNTHAKPRAFLTNQVRLSKGNMLYDIAASTMSRNNPEIFLQYTEFSPNNIAQFNEMAQESPYLTEVEIKKYGAHRVVLPVKTDREGVLVLSDSWYPGWQVLVNGKKEPLLRVNYNFRGVQLQPGEYLVEFRYRPRIFYIGLFVSLVFLTGSFLFLFHQKLMEKRRKTDIIQ